MLKSPTKRRELSRPIPVRLPTGTLEQIERESQETSIAVSALIRKCVMRDYPDDFAGGDSTNLQEDTTKIHDSDEQNEGLLAPLPPESSDSGA